MEDPLARKLLLGAGGEKGKQLLHQGANVEYMSLSKTLGDTLVSKCMLAATQCARLFPSARALMSRAFGCPCGCVIL